MCLVQMLLLLTILGPVSRLGVWHVSILYLPVYSSDQDHFPHSGTGGLNQSC